MFWSVSSFYRVCKSSHGEKNPWCFGGFPWCFLEKAKEKKDRAGDFLECRQCSPLPSSNSGEFWIGNFAKFADKGLCVSTETSDLLAKSPVRMTDSKILGIFGMSVIFTVADFKFRGILER